MNCSGGVKSWDFAMNRTFLRTNAARKKWSMKEKWLGARITLPPAGTWSEPIERARNAIHV